jgi:cytochrome c-type biogenesis protein CcmH/NrfG
MPAQKAARFYDMARDFYSLGGGTSVELERVVKDLSSSSSYAPKETKSFYFLAKVFKQSLDYASAIYSLRYVLRLDPNHHAARAHLAVLLMKHGQEKMCEAALAQQRGL